MSGFCYELKDLSGCLVKIRFILSFLRSIGPIIKKKDFHLHSFTPEKKRIKFLKKAGYG